VVDDEVLDVVVLDGQRLLVVVLDGALLVVLDGGLLVMVVAVVVADVLLPIPVPEVKAAGSAGALPSGPEEMGEA
jgi:hypothetical protein